LRFTETVVRRAAEWARKVTGGKFTLQAVGGNIGHGVRYIDGVQQLVRLGRYGAREAAAYYLAAGVKWAELSGVEVPEEWARNLAVLTGDRQPRSVRGAAAEGESTARYRFESGR
jgi:hypothetical protein